MASRSHHATARVGGGGGSFHNRGALTKLSGPSSSGGSRVPLPVNTSSLRKENGGQDITAVIVNRSGDKKAVWGSAITEKANEEKASTPPPPTTANAAHHPKPTLNTNNPNNSRLGPTPEEAAHKSSSLPPGPHDGGGGGGPPMNKNTPWAIHPPPSQHRDRNDHGGGYSDYYNYPPREDSHRNYDRYNSYNNNRDMDNGGGNSYYNHRRYDDRNRSPTHQSDRYHRNDRYDDSRYGDNRPPPAPYGVYDNDQYSRRFNGGGGGGGGFDRGYNNRRQSSHNRHYDSNTRYNDRYQRSEDQHGEERTLYNPHASRDGGGLDVEQERERGGNSRFRTSGPLYGSGGGSLGGMDSNRHAGEYDRPERDYRTTTTSRFFGERPPGGPSIRDDRNGSDVRSRPYPREPIKDLLPNEKSHSNKEEEKPIQEPELLPSTGPRKILRNNEVTTSSAPGVGESMDWAEDSDSESDEYLSESTEESHDDAKEERQVLQKLNKDAPVPRLLEEEIPNNHTNNHTNNVVIECERELTSSGSTIQTSELTSQDVSSIILSKAIPVEEPTVSNEERRLLQQQNILKQVQAKREQRGRAKSIASEDTVERVTSQQTQEEPIPTEKVEEEDEAAKEITKKNREKFLALKAAERAARVEHRRTRRPRTKGVLWKRLPDGTLVNADLSEEEIARRAEKRLSRENKKQAKVSNAKQKIKKLSHADEIEKQKTETKIPPKKKEFVPAPKPSVSAWVSGPPPSMTKKDELDQNSASTEQKENKQIEPVTIIGNPTVSTSLDDVLSASLLEIGNSNPSWSAPAPIQQPKVAVGPIMSSWTAFGNGQTDFNYSSYGTSKSENGHVPPGADWNMDFALPHDLLSTAAESEEDVKPTEKVNAEKDQSNSKKNRRSKGRGSSNRRKTHNPNSAGPGKQQDKGPGKQQDKKSSKTSNQSKRPRRPYSKTKKVPKEKQIPANQAE